VNVGADGAGLVTEANPCEAADDQLLSDDARSFLDLLVDGYTVPIGPEEVSDRIGTRLNCEIGKTRGKSNEVVIASDEVGFAVDFEKERPGAILCQLGYDCTLASCSAGSLGAIGDTLFLEEGLCLLQVAIALNECLLAVHHSSAGCLAQFFYLSSTNSHFIPRLNLARTCGPRRSIQY